MSLINKMLQDLDARGTAAGESFPSQIKPVARGSAGPDKRVLAAAVAASLAVLATGWFGWGQYQSSRQAPAPAVLAAAKPAPVPAKAAPAMTSQITMLPALDAAPVAESVPAPAAAPDVVAEPKAVRPAALKESAPARRAPPPRKEAPASKPAALAVEAAPGKAVAPFEPDSADARAVRRALM